jgi:hypothetical protein
MRPLVEPPPMLRCMCGGELRLKLIEATDRSFGNREKYSSAQTVAGSKHSSPIGTRMWLSIAEGYRRELRAPFRRLDLSAALT